MPRPAKTPATCGLHQLDPSCPSLSLFENKQIRGWFPMVIHDEEENCDIIQVHLFLFSYVKLLSEDMRV